MYHHIKSNIKQAVKSCDYSKDSYMVIINHCELTWFSNKKYKFINVIWQEKTSFFINNIRSNTEDTLYGNKNARL